MKGDDKKRIARLLIIIILITFTALSVTGHSDRFIGKMGPDALARSNDRYLDQSFDRALKGFILLSGLKMGLAVLKDSEAGISIGVSTQLHIGGLVQSAYDYVDIAWKTLLAAGGVILGLQYVLKVAAMIDNHALTATFSIILITLLLRWFLPSARISCRVTRDISVVMTIITLALYLAVPLSIWGGSFLSRHITAPSVAEAEKGVMEMKKELFPERYMEDSDEGFIEKIKGAKKRLEDVAEYLKSRAKELSIWIIKIITGYVFDCLIFPLLLFAALLWGIRNTVSYVFGINREEDFRRDIYRTLIEESAKGTSQKITPPE